MNRKIFDRIKVIRDERKSDGYTEIINDDIYSNDDTETINDDTLKSMMIFTRFASFLTNLFLTLCHLNEPVAICSN